jgi:hypothetical protein
MKISRDDRALLRHFWDRASRRRDSWAREVLQRYLISGTPFPPTICELPEVTL